MLQSCSDDQSQVPALTEDRMAALPSLLLLLALLACLLPARAFCPRQCVCDDFSLEASCIKSNLEVNIK